MSARISEGEIDYCSHRFGSKKSLRYRYRASEKLGEATFGSLEFSLIERYRLFARRGSHLLTGQVHHSPYQLRKVAVIEADRELFALDGFQTPGEPPVHAIYSERVDVSIYPVELAS
jgi:uncharacterized protein